VSLLAAPIIVRIQEPNVIVWIVVAAMTAGVVWAIFTSKKSTREL